VRFDSGSLGGDQNSYASLCAEYGMEVIVPRTRDHGLAIKVWNNNEPPNLVNVFPKTNGAYGLENWTGICQGERCSFVMGDGHNANACAHQEPNGDNNTNYRIYRWNGCSGDWFGGWNDANNRMYYTGSVICSTNDK